MKKLALVLLLGLACSSAFAQPAVDRYPHNPFKETTISILDAFTAALGDLMPFSTDGISAQRMARVTYSVPANGGTIGAHPLGVSLPANAIIEQVYYYTNTQFAGASGTVALSCQNANNLITAAVQTAITAGTITSGVETGTAGTMVSTTAACVITATVATTTQTAGSLTAFIAYVIHN